MHAIHLNLIGNEPPTEVRLFPYGTVTTEKGTFKFTQTSARLILGRFKRWGIDFGFDYDHGTLDPKVPPKDRKASGWATTTVNNPGGLEIRPDGLWAVGINWTSDAYTAIKKKEFRYLSPGNVVTNGEGEIIDLWNCALVTLPATHNAIPLTFTCLSVTADGKGKRTEMNTIPPTNQAAPGGAATPPAAAAAPLATTPPAAAGGAGEESQEFFSLLGQYCAGMLSLLQENMSNPDAQITDVVGKFMNSDFAKIATEYMDAAKARNPAMMNAVLAKPALALSIIAMAEKLTGKQGTAIAAALLNIKTATAKPPVDLKAQTLVAIDKEFDRAVSLKKIAPGDDSRKRFRDDLSVVSLSLRAQTAIEQVDSMPLLAERSITTENLSVGTPPAGAVNLTATPPAASGGAGDDKKAHLKTVSPDFASFLSAIPDPAQSGE